MVAEVVMVTEVVTVTEVTMAMEVVMVTEVTMVMKIVMVHLTKMLCICGDNMFDRNLFLRPRDVSWEFTNSKIVCCCILEPNECIERLEFWCAL